MPTTGLGADWTSSSLHWIGAIAAAIAAWGRVGNRHFTALAQQSLGASLAILGQDAAGCPTGRETVESHAAERINACADRNPGRRNERHPARQRLLWHLHFLAGGDRGLRRDDGRSGAQQLLAGFTVGALRCGRIIERIGHIRAYAVFGGLVVAATAAMPLWIEPWPWLALRGVIGFGCSGIFVTTESWLSAKAQPLNAAGSSRHTWSAPSSRLRWDSS